MTPLPEIKNKEILRETQIPNSKQASHDSTSIDQFQVDCRRSRRATSEAGMRELGVTSGRLEPMVTEGLSKQPMDAISKKTASMGFNCVRLIWPLFLVTNDSLASLTVRQSCQSLGQSESIAEIQSYNPSIIDLPLIKAYQVKYLFHFISFLDFIN